MEQTAPRTAEGGLVERLRLGDPAAYEDLVREHSGRMLVVARRLMRRNEEDARDVVQEAFLSAFRSIGDFEGTCSLSTWLHRITFNAALMKLRARRRRPELRLEELLPRFHKDGHHLDPPCPWSERGDVALERQETHAFVREAIDRLPDIYRTVLLMRDIAGMSTEQAAEALGCTPNAVKIRLHRAHQALRELLDKRFRESST